MFENIKEKIGTLRETQLGSFVPVLLALVAIWIYFGIAEPVFLSPVSYTHLTLPTKA